MEQFLSFKVQCLLVQSNKNNLIILAIIAAALILFFLWTKPTLDNINESKSNIKNYSTSLDDRKQKELAIKDLQTVIDETKVDIENIKKQLPKSEKRDFLIKDIEELAIKNNIHLVEFLPKDAVKINTKGLDLNQLRQRSRNKNINNTANSSSKALKTVISITSSGAYQNYLKFFADIITYYRAVDISDIIITKGLNAQSKKVDKRFAVRNTRSNKNSPKTDTTNLEVEFTLIAYTDV